MLCAVFYFTVGTHLAIPPITIAPMPCDQAAAFNIAIPGLYTIIKPVPSGWDVDAYRNTPGRTGEGE